MNKYERIEASRRKRESLKPKAEVKKKYFESKPKRKVKWKFDVKRLPPSNRLVHMRSDAEPTSDTIVQGMDSASAAAHTNRIRSWHVVKKFDNGTSQSVRQCRTGYEAEEIAGKMRDSMTDEECAQNWNYQAEKI